MGHKYASTVVSADTARSAVGQEYASTVVIALSARSVVGDQSASTVVYALGARSANQTKERGAADILLHFVDFNMTLAGSTHTHARLPFGKSCATSASQLVTSCATFATCFTAQNGSATSAS